MRAFASSFGAWRQLEENEDIKVPHGLVFPLAVVEAIGKPYGLSLTAEEHEPAGPLDYDAIFITVLDSRCMIEGGKFFKEWRVPLRRQDRSRESPLVWAGGQGLHNPLPLADVFDLCVIGDAESPLPELLQLWNRLGHDRVRFLSEAASIEAVFVPSVHDPTRDRLRQSVTDDITVTLKEHIQVSQNGQRRVEIARGCKYKCTFCSLGWRAPSRENTTQSILQVLEDSPKIVHLQAGDAESHSGIKEIRAVLHAKGGRDNGWTGRLDTTLANPDTVIPGSKRYAFGVEGVSHRLRAAVGKGYLSDERLTEDTIRFLDNVEEEYYGRAAWHLIAGLPTERADEVFHLHRVIRNIDEGMKHAKRRNLALHWQPFQPLPGTPMQWFGCGRGVREMAGTFKDLTGLHNLRVRQLTGRTNFMAAATTILARATPQGGARVLEAMAHLPLPSLPALREMAEAHEGPLDVSRPLPWGFIDYAYPENTLRKAYENTVRKLAEIPSDQWRAMPAESRMAWQQPKELPTPAVRDKKALDGYGLRLAALRASRLRQGNNT